MFVPKNRGSASSHDRDHAGALSAASPLYTSSPSAASSSSSSSSTHLPLLRPWLSLSFRNVSHHASRHIILLVLCNVITLTLLVHSAWPSSSSSPCSSCPCSPSSAAALHTGFTSASASPRTAFTDLTLLEARLDRCMQQVRTLRRMQGCSPASCPPSPSSDSKNDNDDSNRGDGGGDDKSSALIEGELARITALREHLATQVQELLADSSPAASARGHSQPAPPPSLPTAASSSSSSSFNHSLAYMIVGIPTVGRGDGRPNYLARTLRALAAELTRDPADPLYNKIHIYVMNNQLTGVHMAFEAAKVDYADHPAFHFFTNPNTLPNPFPTEDIGQPNVPGWLVRKQTRDIVAVMLQAANKSAYYLFMEDDFIICPRSFAMLHYTINKLYTFAPDWFALRMSFGMNGFLIHNNEDFSHFAQYLLAKQHLRPPDHLLTEWAAGEKESAIYRGSRQHFAYRYNLFHHAGTHSSLRIQAAPQYASCYEMMKDGVVFKVEAFDPVLCGHDDLTPCPKRKWNATNATPEPPPTVLHPSPGLPAAVANAYARQRESWAASPLNIASAMYEPPEVPLPFNLNDSITE